MRDKDSMPELQMIIAQIPQEEKNKREVKFLRDELLGMFARSRDRVPLPWSREHSDSPKGSLESSRHRDAEDDVDTRFEMVKPTYDTAALSLAWANN